MQKLNHVVVMGNLATDVKTKDTSGSACASFLLAVNRSARQADGSYKDESDFIPVTVWGKTAEACGTYLKKGANVLIEGRISGRSYNTQAGEKRLDVRITATSVQFGAK